MSRDSSNPQAAAEPIDAAPEPIEETFLYSLVTAPVGGSLELGSDAQYVYRPRCYHPSRRYSMPPDVFEFVAVN